MECLWCLVAFIFATKALSHEGSKPVNKLRTSFCYSSVKYDKVGLFRIVAFAIKKKLEAFFKASSRAPLENALRFQNLYYDALFLS
jgi:hypothetical protein